MPRGQRWYKHWQNEGFPLWLRERLEERGWNTVDLSEKLETRYTSGPTRWLTGETMPSQATLKKLAEVFELPLTEVLRAAGHLTEDDQTPPDDPRLLHLMQRIRHLDLTHERYLTLSAILSSMESATPGGGNPPGALPPPVG